MTVDWKKYPTRGLFDELRGPRGRIRYGSVPLAANLADMSDEDIDTREAALQLAIRQMGITFTVYSEEEGNIDRNWPLDLIPRIILKSEWDRIAEGLKQRTRALNLFIHDLYHEQAVLEDGIVPPDLIRKSANFRPECIGVNPPHNVWAHICGTDLVRDKDGVVYVLEDNLRIPSGVSYVMENREVMKRVFPELFEEYQILPVDDYPNKLFDTLAALSPRAVDYPEVVVLTPGIYNSAYFEHAYLAQQMGCELVEGGDLVVESDDCVYMKTTRGLERVDVIYRRVDDEFLDPEVFNKDSALGVPGLMRAWKNGHVALANAPGAGVADDKAIYTYVPELIRYYLGEAPTLSNVRSYVCAREDDCEYVLQNLQDLVVKPANESGGYGMLMGPQSTKKERDQFTKLIKASPRNYIAQPMLTLSTVPTLINGTAQPRHVDLRPFILSSDRTTVTNGGLTRVAMRKGSMIVNSSQGGGSKDTWVIVDEDL